MARGAFLPATVLFHDSEVIGDALTKTFLSATQAVMKLRKINLVRVIVAVVVTVSLTFLPILYQQAMAGHHTKGEFSSNTIATSIEHDGSASSSCEEKAGSQSTDLQMNCCDMNCSTVASFEAAYVPTVQLRTADRFEFDAEQLTSRIMFGLMRPPRA